MRLFTFCVLLAQAATGAVSPPQPDFSGSWVLVVALPADAAVPEELTVHQSIRRTTVRGEPMTPYYDRITIERGSGEGVSGTFDIGLGSGTVSGAPHAPARHTEQSVTWDRGDSRTLAFERRAYTGDSWDPADWTAMRETWTLQPNGELAIMIVTSGSTMRARTISSTYRRN